MNDLVTRAAVGFEMSRQRAVNFIASKTRNEAGEPNIVFVLVAVVLVLSVLAILWTAVISPRLGQAGRCSQSIGTITTAGSTVDCS